MECGLAFDESKCGWVLRGAELLDVLEDVVCLGARHGGWLGRGGAK